ncbi:MULTISPECIES: serine--tRNA ligase [Jonquetella]|uniref:Serine--tRNA ligase n=1 Tax=Jonquetella anthropi DSM 22815 TaxID=885272 RepID=H0UIE3_9BACT|nr:MULTISPECIES: serine--tRNA ligase [Jonquetella]EEX47680.1 serine--tRNA ligase [Jonquetella anthropi E3_33 E1]EHM12651.1 seryl-tRNA synthetase [Jonquetella anthropi DSM 22815]ERL24591.1 serine--tRNA ligase [Jonquetella sp. BV3C21]
MLDLKVIREQTDQVRAWLKARHSTVDLDAILALDGQRRDILGQSEELKARRNEGSKAVAMAKKSGADAAALMEKMKELGEQVKELDDKLADVDTEIGRKLLEIPNKLHETVPLGADERENVEVRRWGEPKKFSFEPKAHWDIGELTGTIDSERGVKLAGSRFTVLSGLGARLERAMANYMLDLHCLKQGYTEYNVPLMVSTETMTGTGQLPKFAEDLYKIGGDDDVPLWLIPTAEVPLTNLHSGETLSEDDLPMYMTAYTPCFRREAGSYGKDVRGIMRLHQFDKVEMVKLCTPETSYDELEKLTADAESVLQGLGLPYRVIVLCSGDIGFGSAKTYDVEVWLPSQNCYREISSCSNCEDFQTRRMNCRYRPAGGGKLRYPHSLNGSGLAIGRAVLAVIENYQQEDGSVVIPDALVPYMGGVKVIPPVGK